MTNSASGCTNNSKISTPTGALPNALKSVRIQRLKTSSVQSSRDSVAVAIGGSDRALSWCPISLLATPRNRQFLIAICGSAALAIYVIWVCEKSHRSTVPERLVWSCGERVCFLHVHSPIARTRGRLGGSIFFGVSVLTSSSENRLPVDTAKFAGDAHTLGDTHRRRIQLTLLKLLLQVGVSRPIQHPRHLSNFHLVHSW